MKRCTAVLLAALMLVQLAAVVPASAEEMLTGAYVFMDTCYSPELDVYVAVAKDMTKAHDKAQSTPGHIYYSTDGETWEPVRNANGDVWQPDLIHKQNPSTRQSIVWWPEQRVFVLAAGLKLLISEDGKSWRENSAWWDDKDGALRTRENTSLATDGGVLVTATGSVVRVYPDINTNFLRYQVGTGLNFIGVGASTAGGAMANLGIEKEIYYVVTGGKPEQPGVNTEFTPVKEVKATAPVEVAYSPKLEGWLILNDTDTLHFLDSGEDVCQDLKNLTLSDGGTNTQPIGALSVSEDTILLGTADGRLLTAPNSKDSISVETVWSVVENGEETEPAAKGFQSITAVNETQFLAASADRLYMVLKSEEGWQYHDVTTSNITAEFSGGSSRIEIPAAGSVETVITPKTLTWTGAPSSNAVTSVELDQDLPDGVTAETEGGQVKLTVSAAAKGQNTAGFKVNTANGQSKRFEVSIVDEESIRIDGFDELLIPASGELSGRYQYTTEVIATDGEPMTTRKAKLDADPASLPGGVEFQRGQDGSSGEFVIDSTAKGGRLILNAASTKNPQITARKEITLNARRVAFAEITEGAEKLVIPDSGELNESYEAIAYDQVRNEIPDTELVWSISPQSGQPSDGVEIDPASGVLTVAAQAYAGGVTVKASAKEDASVFAERTVTLTYTDKRKLKEDIAGLGIIPGAPVEKNLNLSETGKYGSTIKCEISDTGLLKPDGTVIRPSREDKKVTLAVSIRLNHEKEELVYDLTIKKADTLCVNGDFADGTYNGWEIRNNTTVELEPDGGGHCLRVAGAGVYQTLSLTNDSSYGFEAVVSAEAGSKIRLVSMKGGTLTELTADGKKQRLAASYDYRKQPDGFEDRIYLECGGLMRISELKAYEITLEQNALAEAVIQAEYSKKQTDIDAAETLLKDFYDLPVKQEFADRLNAVTPNGSNGGNSGNSGSKPGTGSRPSGGSRAPSAAGGPTAGAVALPNKEEDGFADELDTYLLHFKDMKEHWARADVEYMAELKIVNGKEDGSFMPDDTVSRAEFAALITRTLGLSETAYENSFFDVVSEDWYSGYVQTVKSSGFMNGYDGFFNPGAPITREEIAKVIVEAYNSRTNRTTASGGALYFNDLTEISFWAYDYITDAVNLGFMNGISEELFAPKDDATRAQAAVMLRRVYDKLNLTEEKTEEL